MTATRRWLSIAATIASMPRIANAHAFGERYDLPAPLGYFVAGAAATVAVSFAVAIIALRRRSPHSAAMFTLDLGATMPRAAVLARVLSLALFALLVVAGFCGDPHPAKNLTPTFVWILGWVGLSLFTACVGNLWPVLDPVRALFDWIDAVARRAGRSRGVSREWLWPPWVGAWPAVILLLALAWFEFIDPRASEPARIATLMLAWAALSLLGMLAFGRVNWQRHADMLAIYFDMLGRFAPLAAHRDGRSLVVRPWGRGLIENGAELQALPAFVIAMLATVLFDGLLGTTSWRLVDRSFSAWLPHWNDRDGVFLGSAGLIVTFLVFLAAYQGTCWLTARLIRAPSAAGLARAFAPTLVPIVVAYNIAHNLGYLIVQGQGAIALISDPLGRGWNLFGTANHAPDIGIVDARLAWQIAIGAIVGGHVIAVWLAHRVALARSASARRAIVTSIPLTALMVAYTAVSLSVVAEPLVRFRTPDPSYSFASWGSGSNAVVAPRSVPQRAAVGAPRVHQAN